MLHGDECPDGVRVRPGMRVIRRRSFWQDQMYSPIRSFLCCQVHHSHFLTYQQLFGLLLATGLQFLIFSMSSKCLVWAWGHFVRYKVGFDQRNGVYLRNISSLTAITFAFFPHPNQELNVIWTGLEVNIDLQLIPEQIFSLEYIECKKSRLECARDRVAGRSENFQYNIEPF